MHKATTKIISSMILMVILAVSVTSYSFAQNAFYGKNLIENGDFSGSTLDSWNDDTGDKGTAAIVNGELAITGLQATNNIYDVQVNQNLSAEDIALLAGGGTFEVSFDARASKEGKNIHVFLGQVGDSWSRYWPNPGEGLLTIGDTTATYTLTTFVTETWETMRLGFEISSDTSSIYFDNVKLRKVSDNIVINGDFSADSSWDLGSGAQIKDNELAFLDIPGTGNTYAVQSMQEFNAEQLDSIYAGPYTISFDARTADGTHDIHLFIGEKGGGWARYLPESGEGRITIDTEMKTYTREFAIEQTYENMQIGFEVNYGPGDVYIDNLMFTRITDVVPDAPEFQLSTADGIVTVSVTDNGAAGYQIYFADSAFTAPIQGSLVGSIDTTSSSLTVTHTTKAPHSTLKTNFDAYYGVVALSEKGSASDISVKSISTGMTVAENYIVELNDDAVSAVSAALQSGVVPEASVLASYFPNSYKPFTIDQNNIQTEGSAGDSNEDISGKFWVGFENTSGIDLMVIYAEIMDDVIVPTPKANDGGGGWNFDSWEAGIGSYEPKSFINGSDHSSFQSGDEPDYQLRAGFMEGASPFIHAWDGDAGDPIYNQFVGNSQTIGDSSQTGMYRLLTVLSTVEFNGLNPSAKKFDFPTSTEVNTIPFQLAVNDNDGSGRDAQFAWSSKSTSAWWNTPSDWEVVALVGIDMVTSNDLEATKPKMFTLEQNYPNPFNPSTNIQFSLPEVSDVTLEVFNMLGQKVATLLSNEKMTANSHTIKFDATSLASGMYVYRISAGNFVQSRKMMLIK